MKQPRAKAKKSELESVINSYIILILYTYNCTHVTLSVMTIRHNENSKSLKLWLQSHMWLHTTDRIKVVTN